MILQCIQVSSTYVVHFKRIQCYMSIHLNLKLEKVKPNYKKKKTQAINRIKQKERQAYIRQKIKEEKKARYKANHKEY